MRHQFNKGFTALIVAILLSVAMLLLVIGNLHTISSIFDLVARKVYRFIAVENSLACLDAVVHELGHDYFYAVGDSEMFLDAGCTIVSVETVASTSVPFDAVKDITVNGMAGDIRRPVIATIRARVVILDSRIGLVQSSISF